MKRIHLYTQPLGEFTAARRVFSKVITSWTMADLFQKLPVLGRNRSQFPSSTRASLSSNRGWFYCVWHHVNTGGTIASEGGLLHGLTCSAQQFKKEFISVAHVVLKISWFLLNKTCWCNGGLWQHSNILVEGTGQFLSFSCDWCTQPCLFLTPTHCE